MNDNNQRNESMGIWMSPMHIEDVAHDEECNILDFFERLYVVVFFCSFCSLKLKFADRSQFEGSPARAVSPVRSVESGPMSVKWENTARIPFPADMASIERNLGIWKGLNIFAQLKSGKTGYVSFQITISWGSELDFHI
jgi:hypothetical protein